MSARPSPLILASSPIAYWPLNDQNSGQIAPGAGAEEVLTGGTHTMVEQGAFSDTFRFDNTLKPQWGAHFGRCLGAEFFGSPPHNPALVTPANCSGLLGTGIPLGSGIDPLFNIHTWTAESWIRTPVTSELDYDFFGGTGYGGDTQANTCWYPAHGEGHPNDNASPTGFGLNIGTNGVQLLGHHGAYLQGPRGNILLSDRYEHHVVVTCEDVGGAQDFHVYLDGVLVLTDLTWAHSSTVYPVLPPMGVGIGPYTTFYGSVRHFAVYDRLLTLTEIVNHFNHITCVVPPAWRVGSIAIG